MLYRTTIIKNKHYDYRTLKYIEEPEKLSTGIVSDGYIGKKDLFLDLDFEINLQLESCYELSNSKIKTFTIELEDLGNIKSNIPVRRGKKTVNVYAYQDKEAWEVKDDIPILVFSTMVEIIDFEK